MKLKKESVDAALDALILEGLVDETDGMVKTTEKGNLEIIKILKDGFYKEMVEQGLQINPKQNHDEVFNQFCLLILKEYKTPIGILINHFLGVPV